MPSTLSNVNGNIWRKNAKSGAKKTKVMDNAIIKISGHKVHLVNKELHFAINLSVF